MARHLGLSLDQNEETEAPTNLETEAPTEPETEEPTAAPTEAPTDPVTDASTDNSADTNAPADKKGCGASIGLLSVLALSVYAAFALKRRR